MHLRFYIPPCNQLDTGYDTIMELYGSMMVSALFTVRKIEFMKINNFPTPIPPDDTRRRLRCPTKFACSLNAVTPRPLRNLPKSARKNWGNHFTCNLGFPQSPLTSHTHTHTKNKTHHHQTANGPGSDVMR